MSSTPAPDTAAATPPSAPAPAAVVPHAGASGLALVYLLTAIGTTADLVSKWYVFANLPDAETVVIPGFFGLLKSINKGAAWSIMKGQFAFFYAISVGAIALISYFAWTAPRRSWGFQATLALILSGVLGNLHDRVFLHGVRDFLHCWTDWPPLADRLRSWFGEMGNHWPIFNVADSFICVGAFMLLIKFWGDEKRARVEAASAKPAPQADPHA